jgi:excisionase family DNA binding protein
LFSDSADVIIGNKLLYIEEKMADSIETYTVDEVARALKLHPYTIRRLSREGKIPAFKFGGQWRFNKEEIQKWMKEKKSYGA